VRKQRITRVAVELFLWAATLTVLVPLALVLLNSFKTTPEAARMNMNLPKEFIFENYAIAFTKGKMVSSFFNSLLYSAVSTAISNLSAAMAAFVMARSDSRFSRGMHAYFMLGLVAATNYVTTVQVMHWLRLLNTAAGMILLFAAQGISFSVFLFFGFIKSVPRSLDEAAILDGCGSGRLFFQIVFPLLKPVFVTGFVLNFMNAWNDFVTPLYVLNSMSRWGMIMAIYNFFGLYGKEWNLISAVIILTVAPILACYLMCQRYIIAGMTAGAVKS